MTKIRNERKAWQHLAREAGAAQVARMADGTIACSGRDGQLAEPIECDDGAAVTARRSALFFAASVDTICQHPPTERTPMNRNAIFSDDPQAVEKLTAKLAKLTAERARYVAANKCVRKKDDAGLRALGFSDSMIAKLYTPDFAGRIGIPSYVLTNLGGEITRCRRRIEELSKAGV